MSNGSKKTIKYGVTSEDVAMDENNEKVGRANCKRDEDEEEYKIEAIID